jgi:hypothetical protein
MQSFKLFITQLPFPMSVYLCLSMLLLFPDLWMRLGKMIIIFGVFNVAWWEWRKPWYNSKHDIRSPNRIRTGDFQNTKECQLKHHNVLHFSVFPQTDSRVFPPLKSCCLCIPWPAKHNILDYTNKTRRNVLPRNYSRGLKWNLTRIQDNVLIILLYGSKLLSVLISDPRDQ